MSLFPRGKRWTAARATHVPSLLLLVLILIGCSMVRLRKDISEAKGLGMVSGIVTTPSKSTENVVVLLYRETDEGPVLTSADRLTSVLRDYVFILETASRYSIVAFQDHDGDQILDPGEPVGIHGRPEPITVGPTEHLKGQGISLGESTALPSGLDTDFSGLELTSLESLPVAAGEVTTLDDPRFTAEQAKAGMWSPMTALREVGGGIYFLEPYDPDRIPILFVHGIGGSPQDFRFLIERLDRDRYQPWVVHYPSGVRLGRVARTLAGLTTALHESLGFERLFVTAHSMGGLVARSFLLYTEGTSVRGAIQLFVTFSTPWGGHRAAAAGVKYAPVVVPSWIDMQPESDFLEGLRAGLPAAIPHHLFFGYQTRSNPLMLYSHDSVVSVASQLSPWFQDRAVRVYGFDLDHAGILNDEEVTRKYVRVLDQVAERSRGRG